MGQRILPWLYWLGFLCRVAVYARTNAICFPEHTVKAGVHCIACREPCLLSLLGILSQQLASAVFCEKHPISFLRTALPNFKPVYSVMLSSQHLFCLPFLLYPCAVPCRIIFASPVDLVMCPNHVSWRFLIAVRSPSKGPMACLILLFTSSFLEWTL